MELHNLKYAEGAVKRSKRVGRGQGSGRGGTATRGHNGAKSRSGYTQKINSEGGQMPLQMRLPKFGKQPKKRNFYKPINLGTIQSITDKLKISLIDLTTLFNLGLISKHDKVKILCKGDISNQIEFHVHAVSKSARKSIESCGGKIELLND